MTWFLTLFSACLSYTSYAIDYVSTANGAISGATACGTNDLVRTFNVTDNFTIGDVNLGLQIDHTWRGDIEARLISPAGTVVQVITSNTGGGGNLDNYNVLLDDAATTAINTAPHNTPDGTVAPPYENTVQPNSPLSAFNNQGSSGTWTLLMCDAFPGADDGTFDIATLTLIESTTPPTGPTLSCPPEDRIVFNWGPDGSTNGWPAGSLSNSYTIGTNIPMTVTTTGDTQFLIPRNGINTPVTTTEFTGGGLSQDTLAFYADFPSQANSITLTMDIGTLGQGVESVTFDIYDVDANNWIDRVTVVGSLGGTNVPTTLTGGAANTISGNQIIGTSQAASTSAAGNANVTFSSAVDLITITYDNDPAVGANPSAQIMSFFANMVTCPALVADLTAIKSVSVFDPGNAGLYMTPGNEVLYTITVNNSAAATATASDIDISDTLPDNLTFVSATTSGFTGGAFGTPALPAANTDCTGGNCVISFAGGSLPENSTGEIVVRAIIQ